MRGNDVTVFGEGGVAILLSCCSLSRFSLCRCSPNLTEVSWNEIKTSESVYGHTLGLLLPCDALGSRGHRGTAAARS